MWPRGDCCYEKVGGVSISVLCNVMALISLSAYDFTSLILPGHLCNPDVRQKAESFLENIRVKLGNTGLTYTIVICSNEN